MKKILTILIIVVLIVILAGWVAKIVFVAQDANGQDVKFLIESGQGVKAISNNLQQQGIISSPFIFKGYVWLTKTGSNLQAGEHSLNSGWSIRQVVNTLTSGNTLDNEVNITIIEGWNLNDISDYLVKEKIVTAVDYWQIVGLPAVDYDQNTSLAKPKDFTASYEFLKEKPLNLSYEGYLFPDTYRIFKDANAEEIIRKMLDNFDKKITSKMLGDIYNQGKTLYQVLTLASIVEKEADTIENKKKVAGVYYNRLTVGMALQADPTVNYITGKSTDRPSYDDIETDNLYNTYQYPGLPPGPICNPGLDAIMATIYPDQNDYFYFINTPQGKMIFAKTFEQHKANRTKYFND